MLHQHIQLLFFHILLSVTKSCSPIFPDFATVSQTCLTIKNGELCDPWPSIDTPDAFLKIWPRDSLSQSIGAEWKTDTKTDTNRPVWNQRYCWNTGVHHFQFELWDENPYFIEDSLRLTGEIGGQFIDECFTTVSNQQGCTDTVYWKVEIFGTTFPPTKSPSDAPTDAPTIVPSVPPSSHPSHGPTGLPTEYPSRSPTPMPTSQPSSNPSIAPTPFPIAHSMPVVSPDAQYLQLNLSLQCAGILDAPVTNVSDVISRALVLHFATHAVTISSIFSQEMTLDHGDDATTIQTSFILQGQVSKVSALVQKQGLFRVDMEEVLDSVSEALVAGGSTSAWKVVNVVYREVEEIPVTTTAPMIISRDVERPEKKKSDSYYALVIGVPVASCLVFAAISFCCGYRYYFTQMQKRLSEIYGHSVLEDEPEDDDYDNLIYLKDNMPDTVSEQL